VLAEDVFSPIDLPSFNQSAMDGYAIIYDEKNKITKNNNVIITASIFTSLKFKF